MNIQIDPWGDKAGKVCYVLHTCFSIIGQNLQVNEKLYFQLHRHRAMNMTDTINHMISFLHYPKIDPHKVMAEFEIS